MVAAGRYPGMPLSDGVTFTGPSGEGIGDTNITRKITRYICAGLAPPPHHHKASILLLDCTSIL